MPQWQPSCDDFDGTVVNALNSRDVEVGQAGVHRNTSASRWLPKRIEPKGQCSGFIESRQIAMKLQLDDLDELVGQLAVLEEEVDFGHVVELKIGPVFFPPAPFSAAKVQALLGFFGRFLY